jgi:hypothetical protein
MVSFLSGYAVSHPRDIILRNIGRPECGREASPELYSSLRCDPTFAFSWLSIRLHEGKQFVISELVRYFLKFGLCLMLKCDDQGVSSMKSALIIYIYIYIYIYTHYICDGILALMTLGKR